MSEDYRALAERLSDPWWRVTSGALYKIMVKGSSDDESFVMPFIPNSAQLDLLNSLHDRNLIIKARQRGFTTLVAILWLDHALFVADQRCGIVAHDRDSAEVIFRDKVKFAYERLPSALRQAMPLQRDSASELLFAHNNSSVRVATSMRSGTIHRLHISELGKIAAKYPDKAKEVMTGSIPAVPTTGGLLIIESTTEGAEGVLYELTTRAREVQDLGRSLTPRDYKLHFVPWWSAQEYRLDPAGVAIGERDREYFREVESKIGLLLDDEQRAWYVATRDADYPNQPELMWQEYPSTIDEAFQRSTEGCYYARQLAQARIHGRIRSVPWIPNEPVNTWWDLGANDQTAIWFHQQIGPEHRFIGYYEGAGEALSHYVAHLQGRGYIWGRHYLPHDADHKHLGENSNKSKAQMLNDLGLQNIEVLDRIDNVNTGIQQTRDAFHQCWWDAEGCKDGLARLQNYRKRWNSSTGAWANEPLHDVNSNGCLVAGTMIETLRGPVPIESVVVGDKVVFAGGFSAPVTASGMVKCCETLRLDFEDGSVIECSPEHKFFSENGLVRADSLRQNDAIITGQAKVDQWFLSSKGIRGAFTESLTGASIGYSQSAGSICRKLAARRDCFISTCGSMLTAMFRRGMSWCRLMATKTISTLLGGDAYQGVRFSRTRAISALACCSATAGTTLTREGTSSTGAQTAQRSVCTGMYGSESAERSRTGGTSTTKTKTRAITGLRTWSAYLLRNTCFFMGRQTRGLVVPRTLSIWIPCAIRRLSGIARQRVARGIRSMGESLGKSEHGQKKHASIADPSTRLHTRHEVNSARKTAVRLLAITPTKQQKPVYDLTIEKHHAYVANGLLVSNSDAFRQFGQALAAGLIRRAGASKSRPKAPRSWRAA